MFFLPGALEGAEIRLDRKGDISRFMARNNRAVKVFMQSISEFRGYGRAFPEIQQAI